MGRCWSTVPGTQWTPRQWGCPVSRHHLPCPAVQGVVGDTAATLLTPCPQTHVGFPGGQTGLLWYRTTGQRAGACLHPTVMGFLHSQRESSTGEHTGGLQRRLVSLWAGWLPSSWSHRDSNAMAQDMILSIVMLRGASKLLGLLPAWGAEVPLGKSGVTSSHWPTRLNEQHGGLMPTGAWAAPVPRRG